MVIRLSPLWFAALLGALFLPGCGLLDELLPTSASTEEQGSPTTTTTISGYSPSTPTTFPTGTTGVKAPKEVSPATGASVSEAEPTLVASNAATKDRGTVTYEFELTRDESFKNLVASVDGIRQGRGQTSWKVSEPLQAGRYFWRVRAQVGWVKSPWSEGSDFTIVAEPAPGGGGGGEVEIFDPLVNGSSVGDVHGGQFTSQGWKVISKSDYIRYEMLPISGGFVSWENTGLTRMNPAGNQYMLMGMWDPSRGDYRANPFRVHLQKLDTNHNPPYIRLRWIANGEQHDKGYNFMDWEPGTVYRWRIEWGPEGNAQTVRVLLNDQVIIESGYTRSYSPNMHYVELGIAQRAESIVGAVYANLQIGRR